MAKYVKPFDATDPDAGFVNGNPSAGVAGSIPDALMWEVWQRELAYAISQSGQTPTNSDLHQVWKAMLQAAKSQDAVNNFIKQFYNTPSSYWELSSPVTSIPSNALTVLSNYQNRSTTMGAGTDVSASSGVVTIGPNDAGVYVITATNAVDQATTEESIFIFLQRLGESSASAIATSRGPYPSPGNNANDQGTARIIRLGVGDKVYAIYKQVNDSNAAFNSLNQSLGHFAGGRVGG